MEILSILAKNSTKLKLRFSRSVLFRVKVRVSLKYFVTDCRRTRTASNKILRDKSFNMIDTKGVLLQWFKKALVVVLKIRIVRPAISRRITQTN